MKRKLLFAFWFSGIVTLVVASGFFVGNFSLAQGGPISNGFDEAGNIGEGDLGTAELQDIIVNIINIALGFLGILVVIIIIYGGFLWMTAAGNPDQIARARRTLINATIGLAIILLAWAITLFVVNILRTSTGGISMCTVGETRSCGQGGCGTQSCIADDVWGACDTSACPLGGDSSGGGFRVVNEFPRGEAAAALCVLISAEFNNEVDNTTVDGNVLLRECIGGNPADPCSLLSPPLTLGAALAGTVSSLNSTGEDSRFLEFNTSVDLNRNSTYYVELVSNAGVGIRSIDGENLGGNHTWTFTTGSAGDNTPPTVVLTDPANGDTNICLAKTIRVDFSEEMLRSSLMDSEAFTVSGPAPIPTFSRGVTNDNTTFFAAPRALFEASATFTPFLNGNVIKDSCGNLLDGGAGSGSDYTWNFETGITPQCTPKILAVSGNGLYDTDTAISDENVITILGNDFGTTVGEVIFNNNVTSFAADWCLSDAGGEYQPSRACSNDDTWWNPIEVRTFLPAAGGSSNGAVTGNVLVRNEDNGLNSNTLSFSVVSPHVDVLSTGRIVSGLPAAGVGQFMSVSGSNFGATQGASEVYFVKKSNPAERVRAEVQCGINGWNNEQIIIAPPSTMPPASSVGELWLVQIWKDGGSTTHRSNIAEFRYDDGTPGPGLCFIDPDAGPFGTAINVIEGENFEIFPDRNLLAVAFGNESSSVPASGTPVVSVFTSSPDEITGVTVPNIAPTNNIGVFISDGTLTSNSLSFDVLATGDVPVILTFDPTSGGDEQYVTISGNNFGSQEGKVYLSPTESVSDAVAQIFIPALFPLQCQSALWSNTQILVKIPPGISNSDYILIVERAGDFAVGTSVNLSPQRFTLNSSLIPTPGVCIVEPSNGNPGTPVVIHGDNLGVTPDTVRFFNNITATVITSWADDRIDAEVPAFSETGPLDVVVGGVDSNDILFSVGLCTEDGFTCGPGTQCCADGSFVGQCRTDLPGGISACEGLANQCVQSWTFTTAPEAGTSCDQDPLTPQCEPDLTRCGGTLVCDPNSCGCQEFGVVINTSCSTPGLDQSPSPRNNETEACINSQFNVRFNAEIYDPTVLAADAIILQKCPDQNCIGALTTVPLEYPFIPISSSQFSPPVIDTIRIKLSADSVLEPNTWYRITIRKGTQPARVTTAIGAIQLQEDFAWQFKTRASIEPCTADSCTFSPGLQTVEFIGFTADYTLSERTSSCQLIFTEDSYNLTLSDPAVAVLSETFLSTTPTPPPPDTTTATAIAQGETTITGENQVATSVMCTAVFEVDTQVPEVIERFPECTTACTNAALGTRFNIGVRKDTLIVDNLVTPGATIRLYECGGDENCSSPVPLQIPIDPTTVVYVDDPRYADPMGVSSNDFALQVNFGTTLPLNEDEYYQVEYQADQMFGASGESVRENASSGRYIWIFKTRLSDGTGLCSIDHINLVPEVVNAKVVGMSYSFTGEAYSQSDECSERGQRLRVTDYDWQNPDPALDPYFGWAPQNVPPQVGYVDTPLLDVIPMTVPPPADGRTDPVQNVITDGTDPACNGGVCVTSVIGSVFPGDAPSVSCEDEGGRCATLNLQCGYQRDEQCSNPPPSGIALGDGYGVSNTSCCSARPDIEYSIPSEAKTDFCRNGTPKIVFTKELDNGSINGNIFLTKNVKNGICPVGSSSLLVYNTSQFHNQFVSPEGLLNKIVYWIDRALNVIFGDSVDAAYAPGDNLCLVPASINLRPDINGEKREVVITPRVLLDTTAGFGEEYALVVLGDDDPTDGAKVGVRSSDGVTYVGPTSIVRAGRTFNGHIISFNTKREICSIARVEHSFTKGPVYGDPEMRTNTTERFFCAGDNCRDDITQPVTGWSAVNSVQPSGNQHYLEVEAFDSEGNALNADFTYVESGPDFFNREETPAMNDFESFITVDDALSGFESDVRGNLTVLAENAFFPQDRHAKTLGIHLFSCNNPWPDIDSFPFVDDGATGTPATNFEFYYCRDNGLPGTFDDLPALDPTPVAVGTTPSNICYGGSAPALTCSSSADCICQSGSTQCINDGFCAPAGLKDIVFTREDIPERPVVASLTNSGTSARGGEVRVTWSHPAPSSIDGFKVYWGTDEGTYPTSLDVGKPSIFEVTIPNLANGKEYFFTMTSYKRNPLGGQESSFAVASSTIVVDSVAPTAPVGFTAASTQPGIVNLSWEKGTCSLSTTLLCKSLSDCPTGEQCQIDSDIFGYRVFVGTSSGTYLEVRDSGGETETSLNLASGVQYFFRLQSYDRSGNPPAEDPTTSVTPEISITVL